MLKGKKFDAFALSETIELKFDSLEHRLYEGKNTIY